MRLHSLVSRFNGVDHVDNKESVFCLLPGDGRLSMLPHAP